MILHNTERPMMSSNGAMDAKWRIALPIWQQLGSSHKLCILGASEARGGCVTIDELNRAGEADFIAALGAIYEHSPWVAARAARLRPFADLAALRAAMASVVAESDDEERLRLVAAHPDLGGKLARAGALAPSSADEQTSLGLDRLTDTEFETFERLNASYRARFGFPFIIAVKRHTRNSVLAAFEARLQNDAEIEKQTALREIDRIAQFRLDALLG